MTTAEETRDPTAPTQAEQAPAARVEPQKRKSKSLWAKQTTIYPKKVSGPFRQLKWAALIVLLGIYYILPWLRWDRGPNAPDQAVLLDLEGGRFYLFFIELWPQQIYYLTGALILAAVGLFLATSLAGRVWCGYACPQTVWTDLYVWVERLIQGDRGDRIRLERSKWSSEWLWKKSATNLVWILIALATGGAWIFYFVDAPTLAYDLMTFQASGTAVFFILLFTGTTYLLAGFAREQVCIYMCPWPRFQGAMMDEDSLVVTYQAWRGEGRAQVRKTQTWEERQGEGKGDCIDCHACYHACPTGVDIRNGSQIDCIGCGLCIDACDEIMMKIGRPRGLVTFDSEANQASLLANGTRKPIRLFRPRTIIYSLLLVTVAGLMALGLVLRPSLDISVLRDRAPLYVTLADGTIRNAYTFKISNMTRDPRDYVLTVSGLAGATLSVAGEAETDARGDLHLTAPSDAVATYRVFVTVPAASVSRASSSLQFMLKSADGENDEYRTVFMGPDH